MWSSVEGGRHNDDVFLFSRRNVTSERAISLLPTLIRWWEWLRAPEVSRWQESKKGIVLGGMLVMGAMEMQSVPLA